MLQGEILVFVLLLFFLERMSIGYWEPLVIWQKAVQAETPTCMCLGFYDKINTPFNQGKSYRLANISKYSSMITNILHSTSMLIYLVLVDKLKND